MLRHPALSLHDASEHASSTAIASAHDALVAELTWFIDRNNLNGTPPDDEGATDLELAAHLPDYVMATEAVRNLVTAIRDLGVI